MSAAKGRTSDLIGELTTGVSTTEKGIINGITIDTDGNPLPSALLLKVTPAALHPGHKLAEPLVLDKKPNETAPKEDIETSDEAAAAGHGVAKKLDPMGVAVLALIKEPMVVGTLSVVGVT